MRDIGKAREIRDGERERDCKSASQRERGKGRDGKRESETQAYSERQTE